MAVLPPSAAYGAWNKALAKEFFSRAHAGTPVIFWVDQDTAEELAEKHQLGVPLSEAVRSALDMASRSRVFSRVSAWCEQLRRPEDPPPSLPLLAASVVAASMMASDGSIRVTNFYVPLARYLFGKGHAEEHSVLSQSSQQLADLWVGLDHWLNSQEGKFGVSTIKGHKNLTRIGYPISQTVLKTPDRRALSQFFRDAQLTPGQDISPGYLERALGIWLRQHPRAFSSTFADAYAHPDLTEFVNQLVLDCARMWDGVVRDASSGRRAVKLRVRLRMDRRSVCPGWAAEAVDGIDSGTVIGSGGEEYEFGRDPGRFYEGLDGLPFHPSQLVSGAALEGRTSSGAEITFIYQPSDIVFFRQDPDLGWVSRDNPEAFKQHMILVRDRAVPEVTSNLREAGVAEPKHNEARFASGWSLFPRISFHEESKFARAAAREHSSLRTAGVQGVAKPRLVGGLKLKQGLAQNVYLAGGQPDLLVDMQAHSQRLVHLEFGDGRAAAVSTGGFPIPLTHEAASGVGRHRLLVDGSSLSFELVEVLADAEAPGTGTVGFPVGEQAESRAGTVGPEARAIRGALLPEGTEPTPRPLLSFRNSSDRYLISFDGRGIEPGTPELPDLYKRLGLTPDDFYYADVVPPLGWSGWLIEWLRIRITPIAPRRPDREAVLASPDKQEWALAVLDARDCSTDPVWQEYVSVAAEVAR
ncbi:hypothetical protein AB0C84_14810 [Actinomadura sp. NPDC048955]|uniref:hypothetical protein n=1 Tax=Actinomadura sp. NPDC048955 TaxID=3158228 RepID=UPI0033F15830